MNAEYTEIIKYLETKESLPLWEKIYFHFLEEYNFIGAAECVLAAMKIDNSSFFQDKSSTLFAATTYFLQKKDGKNALKFINMISDEYLFILFYKGLAEYYNKNYSVARYYFEKYLSKSANDDVYINEDIYFYLGNCFYFERNFEEALFFYSKGLDKKKSFIELIINIAIVYKENNDIDTYNKLMMSVPYELHSDRIVEDIIVEKYFDSENINFKNIPIFINSRDRVEVLKKIVSWLLEKKYNNIYILDNDSSYLKLKEYYDSLSQNSNVTIFYLRKNMGHMALWRSGILEKLNIKTPYIYTDPDVIPIEECPDDFIKKFLEILNNNLLIKKVGFGIKYDDISFFDKEKIIKLEQSHLDCPLDGEQFFAPIDTTFAVYRNIRYYTFRESIRMGYPYLIKHLPYYFDYDNLSEDELYYIKNADNSSSIAKKIKNQDE